MTIATGAKDATFRILAVCTGNICRSPLTEQLFTKETDGWPIVVTSAGTHGPAGRTMPEKAQALSRRLGGGGSQNHRAHILTLDDIRSAHLILALAREHRRAVVQLFPPASRYTFTLREFARITADIPEITQENAGQFSSHNTVEKLISAVQLAASIRGVIPPPESPNDDDVVDPYLQNDTVYERSAEQIVPAVETAVAFFLRQK